MIQSLRRHEVNAASAEQARQFPLDADETKTGHVPGIELDEYVDVTLRLKILTENRTEQREPPDMMAPAERCDGFPIEREVRRHRKVP